MIDVLHQTLNLIIGGAYSDLLWAGVRALTALCSLFAARAVRKSPDRLLFWVALFLAAWVGLKVADDILSRNPSSVLTLYFLLSNAAWCLILIGVARMANRERA